GKTKAPYAYDALEAALDRPSYLETIRAQVFAGLAELKDVRAIETAQRWGAYGQPPRARIGALLCLGKLAETHGNRREEIIEFLGQFTNDPEFRVRANLPEALQHSRALEAIPHLQRMADQELDARIRRRARTAIEILKEGRGRDDEVQS